MEQRSGIVGQWARYGRGVAVAVAGMLGLLAQSPREAAAAESAAVVVGDSIGVGIATAAGLPSRARISFSLRRSDLAAMLSQAPKGALVILSAGLNDAGDPLDQVSPSLDRAVATIGKSGRRVVWVGPPCVFSKLADRTKALDAHLRERLAGTGIEYVSLSDDWICRRENRTGDGVHFHHAGYLYLWDKIRRDAPTAATITVAECQPRSKPRGGKGTDGAACAGR